MWIRSQDKKRLLEVKYIRINGSDIEALWGNMICTLIGKYSTEEKALKVLEMIEQAKIQQRKGDLLNILVACKYINVADLGDLIFDDKNVVFQMPQDDEV